MMNISPNTIAQPHNQIYENLYLEMNAPGQSTVAAQTAAAFLKRSNLNVTTLGQIWELADWQKKGHLDKTGVFIAFKLVAACQQGYPPNWQSLQLQLGPPSFASRSATPSIPNFGASSPPADSEPWAINPAEQAKYDSIFNGLNPVGGKVPGDKVRPVLLNSGLPSASLARIWELADIDKDGQLDRVEMCIALHLVYRALQGEPVPNVLPPSLLHPSKHGLQNIPTGIPPLMRQWSTSRSRSGSVTSLDKGFSRPSATGQDRARSQSVQPTATMTTPTVSPPLTMSTGTSWPIQTALYENKFREADTNQDGFVSGADVRDILLATSLPQTTLAHLWALVDFKKNGMLNVEQFALILYLAEECKQGKPLLTILPPNLIPPSFRTIEASAYRASATSLTSTVSGGNEELDALQREVDKLILERREADQAIVQLEADVTVKNSEIKNLKIELNTLENTVVQLEKQKGEAQKRLEALDTHLSQLERAVAQSREKLKDEEARICEMRAKNVQEYDNTQNGELLQLQNEVKNLLEEEKVLKEALAQRDHIIETASLELTELESKLSNIDEKRKKVEEENDKLKKVTERMAELIESNDLEAIAKEQAELFADFPSISPVGDSKMSGRRSLSADSFGGSTHTGADPFGEDPFANASSSSFAAFNAFSNKDPFASTTEGFSPTSAADFSGTTSTRSVAAEIVTPSTTTTTKTPPPRPAPPKMQQVTTSPETDPFAGKDPFSSSKTDATPSQFADFANFDAFVQS